MKDPMTDPSAYVSPSPPRYDGIALLRVLACCMVVLGHAANQIFSTAVSWPAGAVYRIVGNPAVPIFLMITGFLLLEKEVCLYKFYKKRFSRILIPLVAYTAAYYFMRFRTFEGFVESFLKGSTEAHLWYIYFMAAFYAMFPFFQKIFLFTTTLEKKVLLALWAVFALCLPLVAFVFSTDISFGGVFPVSAYALLAGYSFFGGYMKKRPCSFRKTALIVYSASIGIILALTLEHYAAHNEVTMVFLSRSSIFCALAAASLFLLCKDIRFTRGHPVIAALADCSFGIYLIHPFFLHLFDKALGFSSRSGSGWLMTPLVFLCTLLASFLVIYCARKNRYLRMVAG